MSLALRRVLPTRFSVQTLISHLQSLSMVGQYCSRHLLCSWAGAAVLVFLHMCVAPSTRAQFVENQRLPVHASSVALDGNVLLLGVSGADESVDEQNDGEARLYRRRPDGTWRRHQTVKPSQLDASDRFGAAVALRGDRLFVGAPKDDGPSNRTSNIGAVYVYTNEHGDTWSQTQVLRPPNGDGGDAFGTDLAPTDRHLLVGAPRDDGPSDATTDVGAAYVFSRDREGQWMHSQTLRASNAGAESSFGASVAMNETQAFVGAPAEYAGEANRDSRAGWVSVFEHRSDRNWTETQRLHAPDSMSGLAFGKKLAVEKTRLAVGAPHVGGARDEVPLSQVKHGSAVYIFETTSGGDWARMHALTHEDVTFEGDDDLGRRDAFGASVALANNQLLVGTLDAYPSHFGSASLFKREASGSWKELQFFRGSECTNVSDFGDVTALSDDVIVIAAGTAAGEQNGTYIFGRRPGDPEVTPTRPPASQGHCGLLEAITLETVTDQELLVLAEIQAARRLLMRRQTIFRQADELTEERATELSRALLKRRGSLVKRTAKDAGLDPERLKTILLDGDEAVTERLGAKTDSIYRSRREDFQQKTAAILAKNAVPEEGVPVRATPSVSVNSDPLVDVGGGEQNPPSGQTTEIAELGRLASPTQYQGKLYFSGTDGTSGSELWSYDGTGLTLAADIKTGAAGSEPRDLTVYRGALYFSADGRASGPENRELWTYDGRSARLAADVKDEANAFDAGSNPANLTVYDGQLFFTAKARNLGIELWLYDGSVSLAADINEGAGGSQPTGLTVYDDGSGRKLYYAAKGDRGDRYLHAFDDADEVVASINPPGRSAIDGLTPSDDALYFQAATGEHGRELWMYDGSAARLIADINSRPVKIAGGGQSRPSDLTMYRDNLYFQADDGEKGGELWRYDGNTVQLVADLNPGPASSHPSNLTVYDGALYFSANDGETGSELWRYDGATLRRVDDVRPGPTGTAPFDVTVFEGALYFLSRTDQATTQLLRYDAK